MKKKGLILFLVIAILLTGCAGEKVPEWELGDVFFYDYKGEAKVAPGDEKTFIYLKDYPSLQTYRDFPLRFNTFSEYCDFNY